MLELSKTHRSKGLGSGPAPGLAAEEAPLGAVDWATPAVRPLPLGRRGRVALWACTVRYLIYSAFVSAVPLALLVVAAYGLDVTMYAEGGPVECLQFTVLLVPAGATEMQWRRRGGSTRALPCSAGR